MTKWVDDMANDDKQTLRSHRATPWSMSSSDRPLAKFKEPVLRGLSLWRNYGVARLVWEIRWFPRVSSVNIPIFISTKNGNKVCAFLWQSFEGSLFVDKSWDSDETLVGIRELFGFQ